MSAARNVFAATAAALLLAACITPADEDTDDSEQDCEPGSTIGCFCRGGAGVRVCGADGEPGSCEQCPCVDDTECNIGEVCIDENCVEGCSRSEDCRAGSVCVDTRCVDGCSSTAECGLREICLDRTCVPGCERDFDCRAGQHCADFRCVDDPL